MAPIRSGVGLRLGANIGYIRFTPKANVESVLTSRRRATGFRMAPDTSPKLH